MTIDVKSQIFEYNGSNDPISKNQSLLMSPCILAIQIFALLIVAFAVFLVIKNNRNIENEENNKIHILNL